MQIHAPETIAIPVHALRCLTKRPALEAAGVVLVVGVEDRADVAVVGCEGGDGPVCCGCWEGEGREDGAGYE